MSTSPRRIFISCGELSGEIHAAKVVERLQALNPRLEIYALGSSLLTSKGVKVLFDYRDYSFSGVTEVLANLSKILSLKNKIIKILDEIQPELILLVDYGGFNLELAQAIKTQLPYKPKIYEFIAPQIWASRPWRINKIKKYIDKVLCTLPFEEKLYKNTNVNCRYVGNPVATSLISKINKNSFSKDDEILIGIFPGSRKSEIQYMFPLMKEAAIKLIKRNPESKFKFILAKAPNLDIAVLEKWGLNEYPKIFELIDGAKDVNHKLLSAADILWLCSGTVTLEAALYGTPHFLAYRSNLLNYLFYLVFRTTNKAGLANIINGTDLAKEFLQYNANSENFVQETEKFLYDDPQERKFNTKFSQYYLNTKNELKNFTNSLSGLDTARIVAEEIINANP